MTNQLNTLTERYLPPIDTEMRTVLCELAGMAPPDDVYYGMIHYHMGWKDVALASMTFNSGKRIRPLLTLADVRRVRRRLATGRARSVGHRDYPQLLTGPR